jgi:tankyrase
MWAYEVMQALLERGANPNTKSHSGETPLYYAALNGMVDRVQLLLQYGADPTIRDSSGKSAIDVAQTTNPDAAVRKDFEKTRNVLLAASRYQRK